ncbi:HlyD family type I secretion periplasmic adaptor subunit [Rhizobium leguminosarum]|uniref:HlyD family type I secretion periplasmic adaptor subunit n=1 Tax=Rhizobium leguminosarum TaxID=384 RepID=UPI001F44A52A|nr:HlyD family type I secretion periplasmic adaptor subunit [Rhizobium leguminosarum]UIJ81821.1 HlyD family type I secretion periplasmic adaptor subunit [Rhizobium leguminosarum]
MEREFLPAALEIVETPASPLGRGVAFTIIAFFCAALAWSWFGEVDIIATAQGQLVPTGKVKVVQPLETGIVHDIRVQDGDVVHAGDLLVALDATEASADRDRAAHNLGKAELDVARLTALKSVSDPDQAVKLFDPPQNASAQAAAAARDFVWAQAAEQSDKIASLDRQIDEKSAQSDEVSASIEKLNATMPLLEQKDAIRTKLLASQAGDRFQWLAAEQELIENRHNLTAAERQLAETVAARAVLERQRDQARAEYTHRVLSDLADAQQEASGQTEDLVKAERKLAETELRAPIDGVVQQLAIHTLGGVVTPAQQLLVIVPEGRTLLLEATVANADVGFIHPGQEVEVKIETFNFTRYGLVHGRVIEVSPDAVTVDRRSTEGAGTGAGSSDAAAQADRSPSYIVRIALNDTSMKIDGKTEPLKPGMAVTAEIKTGSRRIIQYLLSPLRQYAQDAITER